MTEEKIAELMREHAAGRSLTYPEISALLSDARRANELEARLVELEKIDWEFVLAPHAPEDASIRELIRIFGVTRVKNGEMEGSAAWWANKARQAEAENAELRRKLEEAAEIAEEYSDAAPILIRALIEKETT